MTTLPKYQKRKTINKHGKHPVLICNDNKKTFLTAQLNNNNSF